MAPGPRRLEARDLFAPILMVLQEGGAIGLVLSGERADGPLFDDVYAVRRPPGEGSRYVAASPYDRSRPPWPEDLMEE